MTSTTFRVGLAGWGLAGRYFHAPFIQNTPTLELAKVVTSRPVDSGLFPTTEVVQDFETLLEDPTLDLLVIATPNHLHVAQATAALKAGKHVVLEKPVVASVAELDLLIKTARTAGRHLIPFQNRRWDGDFLTVRRLIQGGMLGPVYYFESHWEKYRPFLESRTDWKDIPGAMNGILYDLGSHMIDQTLQLFGKPAHVYAQVGTRRPGAQIHDWFQIHLYFPTPDTADPTDPPVNAQLSVDLLNPMKVPRFHLRGQNGTYEKYGLDPQEARLRAGEMPGNLPLGQEEVENWGQLRLSTPEELQVVGTIQTVPGNYGEFYRDVCATLAHNEPPPVTPGSVRLQLIVIESALRSSNSGQVVPIE